MQHILVGCAFAREVWFRVLDKISLQQISPLPHDQVFHDWWASAEARVPKPARSGFNSLVVLVAWSLWKHRNAAIFEGAAPSLVRVAQDIAGEATLWCMAGAKGLSGLWP